MANFSWISHRTEPDAPIWNVVSTDMEGMKKKTRLKSTDPMRMWTLFFRIQTNAERETLLGHFNAQYGSTEPFYWTSVPDHISAEASIYVRYVYYKETIQLYDIWEIEVKFEEVLI
jgi:hypothetical protein